MVDKLESRIMAYCADILSGAIPACQYHIWAVQRFRRDLERVGGDDFPYVMDWQRAERFIKFCGLCCHYKGELAGKPFKLSMFQAFCFINIFGWIHKDTGFRRFRKAYLKWPRKAGKTFSAAVAALYLFFGDKEAAPDIYCAATKQEQAYEAYEACVQIVRNSPALSENCRVLAHAIKRDDGGKVRALSSDVKKLDGLNPHGAILDEIHAYKNSSLIDVLESGTGSRTQPLLMMITSGGHVTDGADDLMMSSAKSCLDPGAGVDPTIHDRTFYFVLKLDDGDRWDDPACYQKVNPNIGVSVQPDFYDAQLNAVRAGTFSEEEFRTKFLSQSLRGGSAWIGLDVWDSLRRDIDFAAMKGKPLMACDFSRTRDLTACVLAWYDGEALTVKPYFFAPDECVAEESENNKKYRGWAKAGHIILTPGNTIDFEVVRARMLEECQKFGCDAFGYDLRFGDDIARRWADAGLSSHPLPNAARYITNACERFDQLVSAGRVIHDGNPILRWNIGNMRKKYVGNSDMIYYPTKESRLEKIDGAVACIYALYMWLTGEFDYLYDTSFNFMVL